MYDYPDEVKRLLGEAHEVWHQYYNALNEVLQPLNPGYCDWSGILSDKPSYILQCDFCYMIGPEMFDEFVKPELVASCKKLDRSIYHLDGVGQLAHLDSLLTIPELDAVQWVPGSGQPNNAHWPEVNRKIAAAHKKLQICSGFDALDAVISQIGTWKGISVFHSYLGNEASPADLRRKLAEYGVE